MTAKKKKQLVAIYVVLLLYFLVLMLIIPQCGQGKSPLVEEEPTLSIPLDTSLSQPSAPDLLGLETTSPQSEATQETVLDSQVDSRQVQIPQAEPVAPAPEPVVPAPQAVAPAPQAVAPAPQAVAPAPEPVPPTPQPVAPAPQAVAPALEPAPPAPEPAPPAPEPVAPAPEPVVEEDFFADFYVGGEADLSIFEEGSYYVPLFVNNEYYGDIDTTFSEFAIEISLDELEALVGKLLVVSVQETLFKNDEETISLDKLTELGIESYYDYQTFEIYMEFPTWMMPLRFLSVNSGLMSRYAAFSMTGTQILDPARFSWFANMSVNSLLDLDKNLNWKINPQTLFSLQASNSISLFNIAFDFTYNFSLRNAFDPDGSLSSDLRRYFTFQGIQGFYDFEDRSLRLLFGNVNEYLGYDTSTFGIALERKYSYGKLLPKPHQHQFDVILEEPATVEVFINDRSVYRRELSIGMYRLKDFVFSQGSNIAKVVITPVGSIEPLKEEYFLIGYDSRLQSKGDTLYSFGVTFPQYNLTSMSFRLTQQTGFTDIFTGGYDASIRPGAFHLGLSGILALPFGSFTGNLYTSIRNDLQVGLRSDLNYRMNGSEDSLFSSLEFSFGFQNTRYTSSMDTSTVLTPSGGSVLSGTISFSGSIGDFMRYSFTGAAGWNIDDNTYNWRTTVSSGFALIPNMSLSGSISLFSQSGMVVPQLRGQIGLGYTFNPNLSVSASSDLANASYLSASWRPGGSDSNAVQFSMSGLDLSDPLNHQGTLSYSHSANLFGLSLRQQYSNSFERLSTSLTLSTAFAYADNLFGVTRSIGDNFLLVKPEGVLKNSGVAVSKTMSTQPEQLSTVFGVGTYTAIAAHQKNNVVIYGGGDAMLSNSGSFIYDFTPRTRQGFAVTVTANPTFSVVSTLLRTPVTAYARYTTPIDKVEVDESGAEYLVSYDYLYLFTDDNGLFYVSGLEEGLYEFSLFLPNGLEDDPPLRIRFEIIPPKNLKNTSHVFVLETFIASEVENVLDEEAYQRFLAEDRGDKPSTGSAILDSDGTYHLKLEKVFDEIAFWDDYYPSRMFLSQRETAPIRTTDAIVQRYQQGLTSPGLPSALETLREVNQQRVFDLARIRAKLAGNFSAIFPDLDNPTAQRIR